MRRAFLSISVVVLLCAGVFATSSVGLQTRQDPDVLSALLVEVRGLRAAMEQLGSAGPRVQLAMGRLQLNEQRIALYMRRLDEIRDRRVDAEKTVRECQRMVTEMTEALQGATPSRENLEEMTRRRTELASASTFLTRLQNEETRLQQEIATEQDRWVEINQRLDELDRVLTRR
jgi:chromosome segregation ATPase